MEDGDGTTRGGTVVVRRAVADDGFCRRCRPASRRPFSLQRATDIKAHFGRALPHRIRAAADLTHTSSTTTARQLERAVANALLHFAPVVAIIEHRGHQENKDALHWGYARGLSPDHRGGSVDGHAPGGFRRARPINSLQLGEFGEFGSQSSLNRVARSQAS